MTGLKQSQDLFSNAYRKGFVATVRFLISRGARSDEAEEIAQSAWARGWEARSQVEQPASLIPWVNTIALRAFCKERRRVQRLEACPDDAAAPGATGAFGRIAAKVDAMALASRCASLDRALLIDRYVGEAPFDEIARRRGLSSVAARIRVHRATRALQEFVRSAPLRERMAV